MYNELRHVLITARHRKYNIRIGMSELHSRVTENEVDMLRVEQVHEHQTQQQRARQNEF